MRKKKRNVFIQILLGLQPGKHNSKEGGGMGAHFICVSLDHKMGEAYKSKIPQGYINCQELGLVLARSKGSC